MKLKLSPIKQVNPHVLKKNKRNEKYFRHPDGGAIFNLKEDIKRRGITVPLIAKKDGTLLAGHCRLYAALQLNMKTVPVQYVAQKLSGKQETEFVIKDNLLRRHLEPKERITLYRQIYKDFDERLPVKGNPDVGIDVKKIAAETGLNPQTIGYDLARLRHENALATRSNRIDAPDEKAIAMFKKACARMLNIAITEHKSTREAFAAIVEDIRGKLRNIEDISVPRQKRLLRKAQ